MIDPDPITAHPDPAMTFVEAWVRRPFLTKAGGGPGATLARSLSPQESTAVHGEARGLRRPVGLKSSSQRRQRRPVSCGLRRPLARIERSTARRSLRDVP